MDKLVAISSFRRVVEARSFSAAARQLNLSAAAVSKQITWLEAELGAPLLHRTTRSVQPSEVGAQFYERCVGLLDDLEEAEAAVRAQHGAARGTVRINAPMSFGIAQLGPLIAGFRAAHPQVVLEVTLTDAIVNPTVEGADVVIRIARELPDTSFSARRLGTMSRVVCASPAYLAARGEPQSIDDLAGHDCAAYSGVAQPALWQFETERGPVETRITPVLSVDNSLLLRAALVAGAGVGILPDYVANDDLEAGRLVRILSALTPVRYDVHALCAPRRQRPLRVSALLDYLTDALDR